MSKPELPDTGNLAADPLQGRQEQWGPDGELLGEFPAPPPEHRDSQGFLERTRQLLSTRRGKLGVTVAGIVFAAGSALGVREITKDTGHNDTAAAAASVLEYGEQQPQVEDPFEVVDENGEVVERNNSLTDGEIQVILDKMPATTLESYPDFMERINSIDDHTAGLLRSEVFKRVNEERSENQIGYGVLIVLGYY